MAADPVGLALLLGLGITDVSMRPAALPVARRLVRAIRAADVRQLVRRIGRDATAAEFRAAVTRYVETTSEPHPSAPASLQ